MTNAGVASGLIMQELSGNIEYDTSEVKDENGNVKFVQHYNHRAVLTGTAVCPKGTAVPTVGATVGIKGVTLPAPAADGSMQDPTITIAKDGTSGTAVDFLVTAAAPSTSNSDVPKYSITLTRYLENGIGAITTSA